MLGAWLALGFSGQAFSASSPTVLAASQTLEDALTAYSTQSSPNDTQYYNTYQGATGLWIFPNYWSDWRSQAALGTALASLCQWRGLNGYTNTAADQTLNSWLRYTEMATIDRCISEHLMPNGDWPNQEFFVVDLAKNYMLMEPTLSAADRLRWKSALMQMTGFLITTGNLPDPNSTGWHQTDGWYTNGNFELREAEILYQLWIITGDQRYKDLFETQWTHTLSPVDGSEGMKFGLRAYSAWHPFYDSMHLYTRTGANPTLPDGSDGRQWLVESPNDGGTDDYGWDGDYQHSTETVIASEMLILSQDPRVNKLNNVMINDLLYSVANKSSTGTSPWMLDGTHGSRHNGTFTIWDPALAVSAWSGKRTDLNQYVWSEFYTGILPAMLGNAFANQGSPGQLSACSNLLQSDITLSRYPNVPTHLTATATNGAVALSWYLVAGATSYNVKRATTAAGPYATIANVQPRTYFDKTVSNGTTYYYEVSAVNKATNPESINTAYVSATPAAVAPPSPECIACCGNANVSGNETIYVTWINSAGATSYNVKRGTQSGGPYSLVASGLTGANISPYPDTTALNGTTYYYAVTASNAYGESAPSPEFIVTPAPAPAPTGVVATPGNGQATIFWSPITDYKVTPTYNIQRGTSSGGPFTTVANGIPYPPNGNGYTNTGLTNNTTYYYVVVAVNGTYGQSQASAAAAVTPSLLPAPANVFATPGNNQVSFTWAASAGATGYHVKRNIGGTFTTVGSPASPSFTDTGLTNNTLYNYEITATNASGESANSLVVKATPNPSTAPATPYGLTVASSTGRVTISWSGTATTYNVGRSLHSSGPYTVIASSVNATTYADTDVVSGLTYYYAISGTNAGGTGPYSGQATGNP